PPLVLLAPDGRGLRVAMLVRPERAADEPLRSLADEALDDAFVEPGQVHPRQHGVDAVGQVGARIDQRAVQVVDDGAQPCHRGGFLGPNFSSNLRAAASTRASSPWRPMICTPMGSQSRTQGTTQQGWPVRL